jgi:hypothetical protein
MVLGAEVGRYFDYTFVIVTTSLTAEAYSPFDRSYRSA